MPVGWFAPAVVACFLAGCTALALLSQTPPTPLSKEAAGQEFSAARAFEHIRAIAQQPHPSGSPENARVRDYVLGAIRSLGLDPELQQVLLPRHAASPDYEVAYVENIVVRLRGTASTKAVLLMGHYDSTPYGPGAADDGAAVASMLEALRAMRQTRKLKNDVIFLFTDGEESGLLGPRAFLDHPWYKDVGLVLNFEARGYYGPSMMFETGPGNAWLIREFVKGAKYSAATSFMYDVAGRMPTSTDYRILKRDGVPGLNFAFVGGIKYYHTRNDNPDNLSLRSLQHHGEYALWLGRHFANLDLSGLGRLDPDQENEVYFNTIGFLMAHYPGSWVAPLSGAGVALFLGLALLGLWTRRLTWRGIAAGVGALGVAMGLVAVVVGALMYLGWVRHHEYLLYRSDEYFIGFLALTLSLTALVYRRFGRRFSVQDLAVGALAWWTVLLVYMTWAFPGGSYMPLWPLVSACLGLGLVMFLGGTMGAPLSFGLLLLSAVPGIILLAPTVYGFSQAVTIVPAPMWMVMVTLMVGLVLPLFLMLANTKRIWVPLAPLLVAVPLLVVALNGRPFSPAYPKLNNLCYGMNWNTGQAFWMSSDPNTDEWTSNFFPAGTPRDSIGEFVPGDSEHYLKAQAPVWSVAQPTVEVLSDATENTLRRLKLHVRSPREAEFIYLSVEPGTEVLAAVINGIRLGHDDGRPQQEAGWPWMVRYEGLSKNGLDLELTVRAGAPMAFTVRERSYGVSSLPGVNMVPRPEYMITEPNTIQWWRDFRSNRAYSVKTFSF